MSLDGARPGIITLLAAGAALAWCTAAGVSIGVDPMLLIEIAGLAVLGLWAVSLVRDLRRADALRRRLDEMSFARTIDGVDLRVIRGGNVEALALGVLRPTVYLGDASIDALNDDELAAVIHHEDHHRRTLAPLRAAGVEAWLRIVGRSSAARALLSGRLTHLEAAADAYAIARGVKPASIAAALLKVDRQGAAGSAFSGAADHRIRALIDAAAGRPATTTAALPYEWLPLVIAIAVIVGCHLGEVPPRL
ncbi:MAG: hypothetical protein ACSLFN_15330 [Candidatus Limnocylindrales bacterium]